MDAAAALKASPLFKGFTETGLQIIAGICTARHFPQGTPIFVENMMSEALYIVAEGRVALSARNAQGQDVPLGELSSGDFVGELSLVHAGQRMCTATAVTPVNAFEIRQGDFQKLMAVKPQACMKLLMGIVGTFGQKVTDNREALRSLLTRP
jgi:CRP-like cAMP-binding protein